LQLSPCFVKPNPRVDATRGCLAIQRGPIIYCLEDRDQEVVGRLFDVEIDKNQPLVARWADDLLDGVMVVEARGQFADNEAWNGHLYHPATPPVQIAARPTNLVAVPYYAWGNREIGGMRVWIPERSQ
jgi:DUF1680 family protein